MPMTVLDVEDFEDTATRVARKSSSDASLDGEPRPGGAGRRSSFSVEPGRRSRISVTREGGDRSGAASPPSSWTPSAVPSTHSSPRDGRASPRGSFSSSQKVSPIADDSASEEQTAVPDSEQQYVKGPDGKWAPKAVAAAAVAEAHAPN